MSTTLPAHPNEQPCRGSFEAATSDLSIPELKSYLNEEVIDDRLSDRIHSIWVFGSFADPKKDIDAGHWQSDIDIFIQLSDAEQFTAVADSVVPCFVPTQTALEHDADPTHEHDQWDGEDDWGAPAEVVWDVLSTPVQNTLDNAIPKKLVAGGFPRCVDVFIGNHWQFEKWTKEGSRFRVV